MVKIPQGGQKTKARNWSVEEEEKLYQGFLDGKTAKHLSKIHNRSIASVKMKLKRLKQEKGTYNAAHSNEKDKLNRSFVNYLKPKTVLDLYSNKGTPAYNHLDTYSNDNNPLFDVDSNEDALVCLCRLYSEGRTFDLIDLDPYGGAYDCFDLAIKMAKKGLCITFGELGAKRWKRLDYVQHRYGFSSLEEFELLNMINHVQNIGLRNKKELKIWKYKEWNQIGRVWFTIEPFKEYSQWNLEDYVI